MAAILNKTLLIFLFITSIVACADSDYMNGKIITENSYDISLKNFKQAEETLNKAIVECEKNKKVINKQVLAPLKLNLDQLKTALFVLNQRAEFDCENGLREKLFYSAAIHRKVAQSYGLSSGDAEAYKEDLLLIASRKKMDYEAQYLKIDKESRFALERIDELNVPFLLFETIEQFE